MDDGLVRPYEEMKTRKVRLELSLAEWAAISAVVMTCAFNHDHKGDDSNLRDYEIQV